VHGFGFAARLGILGLPPAAKGVALLGFNLGVEVGQLVVAAVCLPLLLGLRKKAFYRLAVLEAPSIALAWLASVWLVATMPRSETVMLRDWLRSCAFAASVNAINTRNRFMS
jgi:hypothetical protein